MTRLQGKCALITGGTSGIGLGIARRFLQEGARVTITGRDTARGRDVQAELQSIGEAHFLAADAATEEDVTRSVEETVGRLGALDVLVNNAAIALNARLLDTPTDAFDSLFVTNVRGPFLYARAAYPHLASCRGSMIHISSDAGVSGGQHIGAYSVTKAAVIMLSKMCALDGAPDGVRSNCICPGGTFPGMRHGGPPEDRDRAEDTDPWPRPPLGRLGTADDIAAATVFLASDEASFYSGVVLLADGAMQAGRPA